MAARLLRERRGCFFVGRAPTARRCLIEGEKRLLPGVALPAKGCLIERGRTLLMGGTPATNGCSIKGEERLLFLAELPQPGAA